jgi:hypothetical protein
VHPARTFRFPPRVVDDGTRAPRGPVRAVDVAAHAALLALAALLPLLRQRGVPSWQTLWAEDGQVFFQQARTGGLATIFRPHAGYLELPPRLLGAASVLVPVDWLAVYMACSATLVTALLAWFVYHAARGWIASVPVRLALASLLVLMPAAGRENTATITNTIWAFAAAAPWAIVARPARGRDVALAAAVAFLAATATPLAILFLPLALAVAAGRRTRAAGIVAGALAAGVALQLAAMHAAPHMRTGWPRGAGELATLTGLRVFAMFLLGDRATFALWAGYAQATAIAATVAVLGVVAVLLRGATRHQRAFAVACVACAVVAFVVAAWTRGTAFPPMVAGASYAPWHMRFSVVPVMLLASAVAVLVAGAGRAARALFVAHVVLVTLVGFPATNIRGDGPRWADSVAATRAGACAGAPATRLVQVPTSVWGKFAVTLPCGVVRR